MVTMVTINQKTHNKVKKSTSQRHIFIIYLHFYFIAQPAGVHYNRDVSSMKAVSEQLWKTLITLEPHGIFLYISTLSND